MTGVRSGPGVGSPLLDTLQGKPSVVDGKTPPGPSGLLPVRAPPVSHSAQTPARPRTAVPPTPGAGGESTARAQEMKKLMTEYVNSWGQDQLAEMETNMKDLYEKKEDDDDDDAEE